jgi:hypothetical protein
MTQLKHTLTGAVVARGDVFEVAGDEWVLTGWQAPTAPGKSGYVFVHRKDDAECTMRYYPSVLDCAFVDQRRRHYT